jgi:hypothetical protein
MLRTQEDLRSNLSPETDYPDFYGFTQSLQASAEKGLKLGHDRILSNLPH